MEKAQEKRIIDSLQKEAKKKPFAYVLIVLSEKDNGNTQTISYSNIKLDTARLSVVCQEANSEAAKLALKIQDALKEQELESK